MLNLSFFEIANYTLVLVFLILFIRYIWIVYFSRDRQPVQWKHSISTGAVSPRLRRLKRTYPDKVRFFNWWIQVTRLNRDRIPGVFVELGVYKGESARILHHLDPVRPLHLFDTFEGFPEGDLAVETGEAATYTPENFRDTSIREVLDRIGNEHNIYIHQGYFPGTGSEFKEEVALVNIDVDLYNPTKAGLELFYPLLAPGGVIMVHDYNWKWPGVIQAVDEFLTTIPENMILLPDINGTAVIIRNK